MYLAANYFPITFIVFHDDLTFLFQDGGENSSEQHKTWNHNRVVFAKIRSKVDAYERNVPGNCGFSYRKSVQSPRI